MSNSCAVPEAVHVGRDGWLFLVSGSNSVIDLYKTNSSFTDEMASEWAGLLQKRTKILAEQGIRYLHLPAPEKLTVLHKFYRGELENIEGSPISQLVAKHGHQLPCLVNPLPYFAQQIDSYPIYWKTDTHWSFWGCYSAYQLLCGRLGVQANSELLKYPYNEGETLFDLGAKMEVAQKETGRFYHLTQNSSRRYVNSIVRFKEAQGLINDGHLHVGSHVVFENISDQAIDQCVVLFGDSFSEYRSHLLTGMLAETFREVHFIWNASIDYEYVRRIQPDVVITELAERFMTRTPDDKLNIVEFSEERLMDYKHKASTGDASLGFTLPKSVILNTDVLPVETYELLPPHVVQEDCVNENNDAVMKSNPISITEVLDTKLFFDGGKCLALAPGGERVVRYGVTDRECDDLPWETYEQLDGTALLFGSSAGAHCYYHWMMDILPKLGLLEKAGIALDSIDHFLVREINKDFQTETLSLLGLDSSRILHTRDNPYLRCKHLIHVEFNNGINMKMHGFVPEWMKSLYPQDQSTSDRIKLYISRPKGVRRGVANEDAMLPILREAGYTVTAMEGMSVRDQAELMAKADVLISPHGGALTNMVFCRPGTHVVELFGRHVYPFYYGLAQMCGHEYHAILENGEDYNQLIKFAEAQKVGSPEFQKKTREKSFDVSLNVLRATLQAIG